jgi:hypothetical protein
MRRLLLGMVASVWLVSCAPEMFASGSATAAQLRKRAAFDMDCPESSLHTFKLDERTRGVSGCGQKLTYVESCDRVGHWGAKDNCTWVLNVDQHKKPPPPKDDDDSSDEDTGK